MGTATYPLAIGAAVMPDGSASNAVPQISRRKSSASAPTPYWLEAWYDATTEEQLCWQIEYWPADYVSTPTIKITYKMASATTGGVAFEARLGAVSDADAADIDAKAYAAANVGTSTVPGTAGHSNTVSFALANDDSVAVGDFVLVYLNRDPAHASDTATGDAEILGVALTYTN